MTPRPGISSYASAVRLVLFAAGCLFTTLPAQAGDSASLAVLGFSEDGGIFAFEEYGEFDGSGGGYSNRYYIDTSDDSFVPGTPIRVEIEDEIVNVLATARAKAKIRGEAIISDTVLASHAGLLAGYHAITDHSVDPNRIVVQTSPYVPSNEPLIEFRLEEVSLAEPPGCENLGDVVGLRLLRIDSAPGGVTKIIHEDKGIPASRGCPIGYRIGAVQVSGGEGLAQPFAILVTMTKVGFEGPDFRWLAFTGHLRE